MAKGKWDHLRKKYEPKPFEDVKFQEKVDAARLNYIELQSNGWGPKELMAEFNKFDGEKDDANTRIKEINVELAALGQLIQNHLDATDVRSVQTGFGKTIYLQVEPSVSVVDRDVLEAHVDANDLSYMRRIDSQMLKTYVKDKLDQAQDDQIPPGIKIYSDVRVRIRKS